MAIDKAFDMLRGQIAELDGILAEAQGNLNAVRGEERLARWRVQTIAVLSKCLGPDAAQRFSAIQPGPSFTQDLLEELADEAELYRNDLATLMENLKKQS